MNNNLCNSNLIASLLMIQELTMHFHIKTKKINFQILKYFDNNQNLIKMRHKKVGRPKKNAYKTLHQPSTEVLSWILSEMQENQEDQIRIICKVLLFIGT